MSDFSLPAAMRDRLRAGHYAPLHFRDRIPYGCELDARYVLAWQNATAVVCDDGHVSRTPRLPVWWIQVKGRVRQPDGSWLVRFNVVDVRNEERYLRAQAGYTSSTWGAIDKLPVVPSDWLDPVVDMASRRDQLVRLERVAAVRLEGARVRRERQRAKRNWRAA